MKQSQFIKLDTESLHFFVRSNGASLTMQYSMQCVAENNVSYNSRDGNLRRYHHLFYFWGVEIKVDGTMMPHFQIYANHFDVMFLTVPGSSIFGPCVASMVVLDFPDYADLFFQTHHDFYRMFL